MLFYELKCKYESDKGKTIIERAKDYTSYVWINFLEANAVKTHFKL